MHIFSLQIATIKCRLLLRVSSTALLLPPHRSRLSTASASWKKQQEWRSTLYREHIHIYIYNTYVSALLNTHISKAEGKTFEACWTEETASFTLKAAAVWSSFMSRLLYDCSSNLLSLLPAPDLLLSRVSLALLLL